MVKTWWDEREWGVGVSLNAIIDKSPGFTPSRPIVFHHCKPFKRYDTGIFK